MSGLVSALADIAGVSESGVKLLVTLYSGMYNNNIMLFS